MLIYGRIRVHYSYIIAQDSNIFWKAAMLTTMPPMPANIFWIYLADTVFTVLSIFVVVKNRELYVRSNNIVYFLPLET